MQILVVTVRSIQENAKSLEVAGRVIGVEVNADKSKYMDRSREQKTGRNLSKKLDNCAF